MEGDLNLSQMLGGLRIANNVDTPPASPGLPPPEHFSTGTDSQGSVNPLQKHQNTWRGDHSTYGEHTASASSSRGVPTQSSNNEYPPYPPLSNCPPAMSSRPSSTYGPYGGGVSQSIPLSTPGAPTYPDYIRASRDPSRKPLPGQPLVHRHSARERSDSDRTYRQSSIKGPMAPRGPNRGMVPGSSSYVENGPLPSSDEWKDRGSAVVARKEADRDSSPTTRVVKKGVKDFNFGRTLGEGSYSTVLAATDRTTLKEYAIKVLDKRHIIKEKKVKYVNIEKDTLNILGDHPGIVRLYYTFQDERSLYFVLDLATGGELLGFLKRVYLLYIGAQLIEC
ncbi:kinase-like domain-containing protein [Terfezia claveryi]|nr:kinase-like domain-containing protein [Terfezia claveryi]